eukprot:1178973-Prorocentrum_minimum.AAC.2
MTYARWMRTSGPPTYASGRFELSVLPNAGYKCTLTTRTIGFDMMRCLLLRCAPGCKSLAPCHVLLAVAASA